MLHREGQRKAKLRESSCIIYEKLSRKIGIYGGLFAPGGGANAAVTHGVTEGGSHGGGWQHLWLQSPLLSSLWVAECLSSLFPKLAVFLFGDQSFEVQCFVFRRKQFDGN